MARKRRRGGRRGMRVGKWVRLAGKILGGVVVAAPAIQAFNEVGITDKYPAQVLFDYTGFSVNTGQFNASKATTGIASLIGGVALMKLFSYVARSF